MINRELRSEYHAAIVRSQKIDVDQSFCRIIRMLYICCLVQQSKSRIQRGECGIRSGLLLRFVCLPARVQIAQLLVVLSPALTALQLSHAMLPGMVETGNTLCRSRL